MENQLEASEREGTWGRERVVWPQALELGHGMCAARLSKQRQRQGATDRGREERAQEEERGDVCELTIYLPSMTWGRVAWDSVAGRGNAVRGNSCLGRWNERPRVSGAR